jgi:CubicO group peptidase (beta-lactamase class C family)
MVNRLRQGRFTLITLFVLAQSCASVCASADFEQDPSASIETILSNLRELTQVPAFSVAIVQNGQVMVQATTGEVDTRNQTDALADHRFRLASVSKVVGATMLASLVQSGDLDPGAPIGGYIEGLPEQYQELTALQLLSHTSGLPHYQARDALIAKTHYDTALDALDSVGDRALVATPGESYLYSTHGYTILSAVYESITGESLRASSPSFMEVLAARESPVLEDWQRRDSRRSNIFAVDADGSRTLKPRDQSYSPFGTGFTASATDLAYFGDAVLHSSRIHEATRELLFNPVTLSDGGKTGRYDYSVAFGWRVGQDSTGRSVYHHAGVTEGARSVLILYPESGVSIAFLSNASWTAQIEKTGFALANFLLEEQSPVVSLGDHNFTGSFDGHPISGVLACDERAATCQLSDNSGALSQWLMRYSPKDDQVVSWPSLFAKGESGDVIKLVTSVGVVEMRKAAASDNSETFQAEFGNGRMLVIRFQEEPLSRSRARFPAST